MYVIKRISTALKNVLSLLIKLRKEDCIVGGVLMTQGAAGIGTIVGNRNEISLLRIPGVPRNALGGERKKSCEAKVFFAITQHRHKETIGTSAPRASTLRGERNLP